MQISGGYFLLKLYINNLQGFSKCRKVIDDLVMEMSMSIVDQLNNWDFAARLKKVYSNVAITNPKVSISMFVFFFTDICGNEEQNF